MTAIGQTARGGRETRTRCRARRCRPGCRRSSGQRAAAGCGGWRRRRARRGSVRARAGQCRRRRRPAPARRWEARPRPGRARRARLAMATASQRSRRRTRRRGAMTQKQVETRCTLTCAGIPCPHRPYRPDTGTRTTQPARWPTTRTRGGTTPNRPWQARAQAAAAGNERKKHEATRPAGARDDGRSRTEGAPAPNASGATAANRRPQRHRNEPRSWPQGQRRLATAHPLPAHDPQLPAAQPQGRHARRIAKPQHRTEARPPAEAGPHRAAPTLRTEPAQEHAGGSRRTKDNDHGTPP